MVLINKSELILFIYNFKTNKLEKCYGIKKASLKYI